MFGYGWRPEMGSYAWIPASNGSVPPTAVVAGQDVDGSTLYAGRAFYEGDLLPAKISPSQGAALVAYGSSEHKVYNYEVLSCSSVAWQSGRGGTVPANAIVMGTTSDGEKLYMGRVLHEGSLTPGKIQPSHGVLYIPFGGEEISVSEYEVLVQI